MKQKVTEFLQRTVKRYWLGHPCIIRVTDMAVGTKDHCNGRPVTAFRYTCFLCGREFVNISGIGLEQIASGISVDDVLHWVTANRQKEPPGENAT